MAKMPEATWQPTSKFTLNGSREQRGLVLHVQEGNNNPWGWFEHDGVEASSDFWVSKLGEIVQYVDTGKDRAWAQGAGNAYYASVETEGFHNEPLTGAQIEAVAKIMAWGHARFGWPIVSIDNTTGRGLTWHGAGGAAWGGHYDCPGEIRKAQRARIIERAQQLVNEPPSPAYEPPRFPGRVMHLTSPMMHGDDVRDLQARLRFRGWQIAVDGWYGPGTRDVVTAFQREKGIKIDGWAGQETWNTVFRNDNITR